jgi:hexosaminidase
MRGNCIVAAEAARAHGATGFLNTDWGDMGHLQYLPVSEPGFAYGAATSWCLDTNRNIDLAAALDAHCFGDPSGELGVALLDLGDAYLGVVPKIWNMSVLTMHLYWPQLQLGRTFSEGLTIDDLLGVEATLTNAVGRLGKAEPKRPDGALVLDELRAGAALVSLMCRDARLRLEGDGWLSSISESRRRELADELEGLIGTHHRLWLSRNRPGGLDDSLAWLEHLRDCYRTGTTDRAWGGW